MMRSEFVTLIIPFIVINTIILNFYYTIGLNFYLKYYKLVFK
jgi:hypothetical protein